VLSVLDMSATLGASNPLLTEVISNIAEGSGRVVPIPTLPSALTAKSSVCWAAVGTPVAALFFPPSTLNIPWGFWVLMPTCEKANEQKESSPNSDNFFHFVNFKYFIFSLYFCIAKLFSIFEKNNRLIMIAPEGLDPKFFPSIEFYDFKKTTIKPYFVFTKNLNFN
jgi:hypothetical protein